MWDMRVPVYPKTPTGSNDMRTHRPRPVLGIAGLLAAALLLPLIPNARAAAPDAAALVTLGQLFADHAVLQSGMPIPVWGTAAPGETVSVSFRGQTARTVADAGGNWLTRLKPLHVTAEPADLVARGTTSAVAHDVVVGEVWLCSGQSNMEFTVDDGGPVYRAQDAEAEVASANYPLIRQFRVERAVATAPARSYKSDGWKAASPENVGRFSAVGYFFARHLHLEAGVPVGIILTCWGGTPIESWLSDGARASTSIAGALEARWKKEKSEWPPERVARYPDDMKAWQKAESDAHASHTKNTLPWPHPPATDDSPARPGGLYNAMIAPLEPCAVRGFLWYQGEANVGHADEYAELLRTLITSWRDAWGSGSTPFYFVQLANYASDGEEAHTDWPRLRDAQTEVLDVPATGMAVTIDIGEAHNIHPRNKQEVGRRLALIAETRVYNLPAEVSGPVFAGAAREGAAMRVRFTHAGGELEAKGGPVSAVEVASTDRVFHAATVQILGDTLLASSPEVPNPVAVRYAWTNAPTANLYGDSGLPAVPFRSDGW
jgi:sialate O-acetylesterase